MKPKLWSYSTWLAGLCVGPALSAQNIDIGRFKIAGGGGTSAGGEYSLRGSIGQCDASPAMNGGNLTVFGGFWSLVSVVQTPGAPVLSITLAGTDAILSWPSPASGFVLQENSQLKTSNWTAVGVNPRGIGLNLQVTVPANAGRRFYRLQKP
jgi:hypothetical protein